jgi:hypothetical protein
METRLGTLTGNPDAPIGLPEAFDDHMSVTYDLMHLALQGDISRVFTFMIGHEPTDRSYAHIGVPETHHSISHHGNDAEKLAKYAKIGTYQMVKFAEFLEKVKNTKDGDGNLLDHSLFYWGSGMSNGNLHDRSNPPTLLVGGAHGRLKGNRTSWPRKSRRRTCCSPSAISPASRSRNSAPARGGWISRTWSGRVQDPPRRKHQGRPMRPPFLFADRRSASEPWACRAGAESCATHTTV